MIQHPIQPLYDTESRVLILGSFPSPKSREAGFFYGHPRNRFWQVMTDVLSWPSVPATVEEKRRLLLGSRVAVWDTIASCDIRGASDASITNMTPNDLTPILSAAPIGRIFCNGARSWELYRRYIQPVTGREAVKLPSTSPANAACSTKDLEAAWSVVREELERA